MGSWIALVGSAVIGGLALLSFIRFNNDLSKDMYLQMLENSTYINITEVASIIETDFSQMGLGINDPTQDVFISADSTDIRFFADIDNDGSPDTMRYYMGTLASASGTDNPHDKVLYRVAGGAPEEGISTGLTDFKVQYYDMAGNEVTNYQLANLRQVKTLAVNLKFESWTNYDNQYAQRIWQGKITPPNLVTN